MRTSSLRGDIRGDQGRSGEMPTSSLRGQSSPSSEGRGKSDDDDDDDDEEEEEEAAEAEEAEAEAEAEAAASTAYASFALAVPVPVPVPGWARMYCATPSTHCKVDERTTRISGDRIHGAV